MKNPPGAALRPQSAQQPHGRDRRTAPARPRSPPMRALPAGDLRINWGPIRPYDAQTEFGEHISRPRDQASHHNSVANSVWQRAKARNRSRAREPDAPSISYPRPHRQIDTSDRPRDSTTQPSTSDPDHRAPQPPTHMEPRDALWPGPSSPQPPTWDSATASVRGSAARWSRLRLQAKQWLSEAIHSASRAKQTPICAYYLELRLIRRWGPQWSYSPPHKAPRRAEDTLPGYRQRSATGFPESSHGYYKSKQAPRRETF